MNRKYFRELIAPALFDTLKMLFITMIISGILGFLVAIILTMTHPNGLKPNNRIYRVISFFVNTIRSLPFVLLVVILAPLTRLLIGSIVGIYAAIVPMSIGGIPLIGKILENEFLSVRRELIEAARSFGSNNIEIFINVILRESLPGVIN